MADFAVGQDTVGQDKDTDTTTWGRALLPLGVILAASIVMVAVALVIRSL